MPEPASNTTPAHDLPEIGAFRYTGTADSEPLNPLNLNGLRLSGRRPLSERLLEGMRFKVEVAPSAPAPGESEGMSVFKYQLPLQEYRARRRQQNLLAKRAAIAGAIALPLIALFALRPPAPVAPPAATAPVALTAAALPASPTRRYAIQEGDTLGGIAKAHRVKLKALLAANGMPPDARLKIGQLLVIPASDAPQRAVAAQPPVAPAKKAGATYTIQNGDTLGGIAHDHDVPLRALLAANGLEADARLKVGRVLAIPSGQAIQRAAAPDARPEAPKKAVVAKGGTYTIRNGDTLGGIAERLGVRTRDLMAANGLDADSTLRVGKKLRVPSSDARGYRGREERKRASRGLVGDLGRAISARFIKPTMGRISSNFGYRDNRPHLGVDIRNPIGARIMATRPGVVRAAGWDGDYGKTVDIDHGKGIVTRYAHCSKILVKPGQRVGQGQTIALVGQTGRATGPHLHYEVRVNGRPVNPNKFL